MPDNYEIFINMLYLYNIVKKYKQFFISFNN